MTPLHIAAKNGKAEFVKAIIADASGNAKFDARDIKGNTVYHYAAQANKETIDVNQVLLSVYSVFIAYSFFKALSFCALDGLINSKNKEGNTPLHLACMADKPDCVKSLIAAGANINLSSSDQGSIVQTAVATSSACAKEILTAFPNQLHAKVSCSAIENLF